jgi:phosphate transport system permease protein
VSSDIMTPAPLPPIAPIKEVQVTPPSPHQHKRQFAESRARSRRFWEWIIEHILMVIGLMAVAAVVLVLLFMLRDALPLFFKDKLPLHTFLFGTEWRPISVPEQYGIWALIMGTTIVTVGASVIAIPLGFACAVYLAELAPRMVREFFKPVVELLAAVPSVVMGFIGYALVSMWVRHTLKLNVGLCALTAVILLALMALPTIISIAEDAITAVPRSYREGSMALGASLLATIRHAILPAAGSGLVAAAMLGIGRALGETMVVLMVAGNSIEVPLGFLGQPDLTLWNKLAMLIGSGFGLFNPARTMTATIASEMGEVAVGSTHYHALFAVGALLVLMSLTITLISDFALRRVKKS